MEEIFAKVNGSSVPEGRQLKALITLRGLRVQDVAVAAGMGSQTLYRVLAGTRALSEDERARLHAAIGANGAAADGGPLAEITPQDATPPSAACAGTSPSGG